MGGDNEGEGAGLSHFVNAERTLVGLLHDGAGTDDDSGVQPKTSASSVGTSAG